MQFVVIFILPETLLEAGDKNIKHRKNICKIENVRNDLYNGLDINTLVSKYEFYDLSHLNKSFIKVYGITPLEYIKLYENK